MKSACIALFCALIFMACADHKDSRSDDQFIDLITQMPDCAGKSVLIELASDCLVNIDTIVIDSCKHVVSGVIRINGIGFGCNPVYDEQGRVTSLRLYSSHDYEPETVGSVRSVINSHFGHSTWDDTDCIENTFWSCDSMYIKMRRVHTDEGGILLMWVFRIAEE